MTETSSTAEDAQDARPAGAARTGRRIGVALFWLMAVYVVSTSTLSVVTQLYGNPRSLASDDEAACASQLAQLTGELQDRAATTLTDSSTAPLAWLGPWDRRFTALEGRCERLEATRELLGTERRRIGHMLRDYHHQDGPELARIRRRLQPFIAP